jgi:hypothetical protein
MSSRSDRPKLKALNGRRQRWTAQVERFGTKRGWKGRVDEMILLRGVKDEKGETVADHSWIPSSKALAQVQEGDRIAFFARVKKYERGYFGRREDVYVPPSKSYKFERPTKVEVLQRETTEERVARKAAAKAEREREEAERQESCERMLSLAETYLAASKSERKALRQELNQKEWDTLALAINEVSARKARQRRKERNRRRAALKAAQGAGAGGAA